MHNDTVLRLAKIPGIIGIKDATGNLARGIDLLRLAPTEFAVYSGDDPTAMAFMFCGAKGNISVTANIVPRLMHELCQAAMSRDVERAITINNQLFPLHDKLFIEPNPLPIKWAMMKMGLIPSGIRLPLTPLSEHAQTIVYEAMRQANLLS
jgi:4-hydroxy-tetrahydrodipicolinate synthase